MPFAFRTLSGTSSLNHEQLRRAALRLISRNGQKMMGCLKGSL
jgi:hypothetical protein